MGRNPEVFNLPRGGIWARTSAGAIQFGIPPETIKDSMERKLEVPAIFVVPHEPFERHLGVNVAEFEFPAYYNYFLLKRRVRLIVESPDVELRLRTVMEESLFGPKASSTAGEHPSDFPEDARPNFARETEFFRRGPGGRRLEVDTLVEFVHFDSAGIARLDAVEIQREQTGYVLRDGGKEIAKIPGKVDVPGREITVVTQPFDPPDFGITVLGASHGFDPHGKTTGFVLWMGGRGVLVDPPVGATDYLRLHGVSTKLIDGVILTHCHADHDSGTFQKILDEGRVNLFTTPTILGSFLRKYSALSGIGQDVLRRTFVFKAVRVAEPSRIHGGEVWFHYALHSIPTIGFSAFYGGRSLSFSSDTLYDPARINQLAEDGVIGAARRDHLLAFPWHHDIVLHEAGIPPLHTPPAVLAALPESSKKNLWLVHTTEEALPKNSGLKMAPVGIYRTLRVDVERGPHQDAVDLLDDLSTVEIFKEFGLPGARDLLQVARRARYEPGTRLVTQGEKGDSFFVVVKGEVSVMRDEQELKSYRTGDYFGETALVLDRPRNADVIARTNVEVIEIDRHDFMWLLRGTGIEARLERLAKLRDERAWEIMMKNSLLRGMSSAQKTQLQSWLEVKRFSKGEMLWHYGSPPLDALLVDEGTIAIESPDGELDPFGSGAFLGEADALMSGRPLTSSACAVTDGRAFRITADGFQKFVKANPGLLVSFYGTRFVE